MLEEVFLFVHWQAMLFCTQKKLIFKIIFTFFSLPKGISGPHHKWGCAIVWVSSKLHRLTPSKLCRPFLQRLNSLHKRCPQHKFLCAGQLVSVMILSVISLLLIGSAQLQGERGRGFFCEWMEYSKLVVNGGRCLLADSPPPSMNN